MIDHASILCLALTAVHSQQHDYRLKTQAIFLSETRRVFQSKRQLQGQPTAEDSLPSDNGEDMYFDRQRLLILKTADEYADVHRSFTAQKGANGAPPKRCCCCYSSFDAEQEKEYQSSTVERTASYMQLKSITLQIVIQEVLATIIHHFQAENGLVVAKGVFIIPFLSLVLIVTHLCPETQKHAKKSLVLVTVYYSLVLLTASYFYSIPFNGKNSSSPLFGGQTVHVDPASGRLAGLEMMFGIYAAYCILLGDTRLDLHETVPSFIMLVVVHLTFHEVVTWHGWNADLDTSYIVRLIFIILVPAAVAAYGAQKDRRVAYMIWKIQSRTEQRH
jgi:hypothetical protein